MAPQADLNSIARAEANPSEARRVLLAVFGQPAADLLQDAYLALRSWTWKALDQRRRDAELRDWHGVLEASSSLMAQHGQPVLSQKLAALGELVAESVAVSETLAVSDIIRRQHVAAALRFLAHHDGEASRRDIGEHLSLGQANLTRVLNLMLSAGLIERTMLGKEAFFRLSRGGMEAERRLSAGRRATDDGRGRDAAAAH